MGGGETPHTCRGANLLATRFQSVLNFGSTRAFFVLCGFGFDEGGTAIPVGETNASFHPDGRSKTGSSPMSRDLMDIRTSASSESESQVGIATVRSQSWVSESSRAAAHSAGEVETGSSSRGRSRRRRTSLMWSCGSKSKVECRYKYNKEKELENCKLPHAKGDRSMVGPSSCEGVYGLAMLDSGDRSALPMSGLDSSTIEGLSHVNPEYGSESMWFRVLFPIKSGSLSPVGLNEMDDAGRFIEHHYFPWLGGSREMRLTRRIQGSHALPIAGDFTRRH